jgi:hypothetical protein
MIARDAYVCGQRLEITALACGKAFEVLSVEHDHMLYGGGPPRELAV